MNSPDPEAGRRASSCIAMDDAASIPAAEGRCPEQIEDTVGPLPAAVEHDNSASKYIDNDRRASAVAASTIPRATGPEQIDDCDGPLPPAGVECDFSASKPKGDNASKVSPALEVTEDYSGPLPLFMQLGDSVSHDDKLAKTPTGVIQLDDSSDEEPPNPFDDCSVENKVATFTSEEDPIIAPTREDEDGESTQTEGRRSGIRRFLRMGRRIQTTAPSEEPPRAPSLPIFEGTIAPEEGRQTIYDGVVINESSEGDRPWWKEYKLLGILLGAGVVIAVAAVLVAVTFTGGTGGQALAVGGAPLVSVAPSYYPSLNVTTNFPSMTEYPTRFPTPRPIR